MSDQDFSSRRAPRAWLRVCGLIATLATLALWFAVLAGRFGTVAWPLDLFANFQVQYMGSFAICVIVLTLCRWRKTAILALLGVFVTTMTMAPYFQERVQHAPTNPRFRLITFNAWFRSHEDAEIARYLESSDADIIVMQELDAARIERLARAMPHYPYRSEAPSQGRLVAIFSRWPLLETGDPALSEQLSRASRVTLQWQGQKIAILGVHLRWPFGKKAGVRNIQLGRIATLARAEPEPLIVAGDFNLTPWSRFFGRFVEQSGLTDCALGQGLRGTWPAQFAPLRIRIDQCFVSPQWRTQRVTVGPKLGSDHLPLIVDLELVGKSS